MRATDIVQIEAVTDDGIALSQGGKRWREAWASVSSVVAARVPQDGASVLTIAIGFGDERVVLLLEYSTQWDSFCSAASDNLEGVAPPSMWQKALSEPGMLVLYGSAAKE